MSNIFDGHAPLKSGLFLINLGSSAWVFDTGSVAKYLQLETGTTNQAKIG